MLAGSALNLAKSSQATLIEDQTEEALVQSMANLAIPNQDPAINNAIDQLTEQLAAFCLEQFKNAGGLNMNDESNNETDEHETQVQDNAALRANAAANLHYLVHIDYNDHWGRDSH
jgi:hypothetical protein